ncbi:hypothetical protein BDV28DRAFT_142491 [Aspergillus coremiiformis]|uniref:Uncharacterized protein n=1 Tax=Aspergillus coremiiformis TaxID=138285 RepID=A0A5N6YTX7_9EURO|nr:hypothetical protein BDV28DRAFT_142491 [Aspergillus coremiiformis]
MEQWGGVKGWEVVLRKREEERLRGGMQISCGRENEGGGIVSNAWDTDVIVSSASSSGGGEGGSMLRGRRKPVVVSSPVPAWLLMEVGRGRSFADLRGLVCRVRGYLDALRERGVPGDRIVFPDIELLPVFQSWVLAPVVKKRRRRVNGNGVV